jgi:regulator of RNase E activity RraA
MSIDPSDFAWMRAALYTAVVADVLDALGLRSQVVGVPLTQLSGRGVLVGRAKTTLWEDLKASDPRPYELELAAVDACRPNEIIVAAAGGSMRSGIWGELLSTAARNRGCAGAIVDGAVRDMAKMREIDFAVFARGTCPRDSLHRQRVIALDVEVELGGVRVGPGDLIVADLDGMVVIPGDVERQVVAAARDKIAAENQVRDEIRAGSSAGQVFGRHGVL